MSEIELCYRQQIKFDFILFIKRLQQEVSTRWNSSYYMLQNLLEQKRALGAYAADYELPATFTVNQWGLIENMLSLLQTFWRAHQRNQLVLHIDRQCHSFCDGFKRFLGKAVASDHGVKTAKSTLMEAVMRRFSEIEKEPLYTLATIIDPRDSLYSEELKAWVRGQLWDLLDVGPQTGSDHGSEADETGEPAEGEVPRPGSLLSIFAEIMEEKTPQQAPGDSAVRSQMDLYLSEPPISRSAQPLVYWKSNKDCFPALATVARVYLSAPCTGVESERLFSAASNIINEPRNRLSSEKAEILLFIKKNMPTMLKKS